MTRPLAAIEGQATLDAPGFGEILLAWSRDGLVALQLPGRWELLKDVKRYDAAPDMYTRPLLGYFAGEEIEPAKLPVDLRGTDFQVRVWNALRGVARGQVRSYAGIAIDVHVPRAMRAVGAANGKNPVAIVVPCHRIVEAASKNGAYGLGGYTGGLEWKRRLLELEGVKVDGDEVLPGQLDITLPGHPAPLREALVEAHAAARRR